MFCKTVSFAEGVLKKSILQKPNQGNFCTHPRPHLGLPAKAKTVIPTHCAEHPKKVRATAARLRILIFATPPGRERDCEKSYIFKCFFDFSKSSKISMHFLHTSSILSVSLFEIAKSALAKRYAHCCFVKSDACRLGGVKKIGIGAPTHYESDYLL